MTDKQIIEKINQEYIKYAEHLQDKVDEYLKNKDNSLEDRWEVWTKYSQTNSGNYIHHFPKDKFGDFEKYFYRNQERYLTIDYEEILEYYEEFLIDELELYAEDVEDNYRDMQEYLMEQNLRSYKFDW